MSDPEITNFAGSRELRAPGDHSYGLTTPKALRELEVEHALEAAWQAGYDVGLHVPNPGRVGAERHIGYELAKKEAAADDFRQRQQVRLEMAKAVAQAIAAMSQIIDETGGTR